MSKRILHLLTLLFGVAGLVACIAAIIGIWGVNSRVDRATGNAFGAIDDSLVAVETRIAQAQDRVQALKITTADIEHSVKDWTKSEARVRLASRFGVVEKAERLASDFEKADDLLELTQSSVQLAQRALDVGRSLGVPVQTDPADRLLEELISLRDQLQEAIEPVETIGERTSANAEDGLDEEELNQIVQLAVRIIATMSSIDSRLENLGDRLTEIQTRTRAAKTTVTRWIRITAIGITLLIAWMAAGQGSLCFLGWKGLCRERMRQRSDDQ